jgi:dihydroorotase
LPYDLLIKGGHVIDAKNNIDTRRDVAIKDGKIARVARSISANSAERVIDASGLYVTPGLIDIHGHHFHGTEPNAYLSNSFTALPPDGFTFRAGVTTAVDVGGPGWTDFRLFKEQVIDRSRTRVLAFINIIGVGMKGVVPYEQNLSDMDPRMTALVANQFSDYIVGVKIAHYHGHDWEPYRRTVEAAEQAGIPVMVDFGGAEPALPLEELFFDILRPGDIYTHAYGGGMTGHGGRQSVVGDDGNLRPRMLEAQEHGIIFDVGHGGGSFFYEFAIPATGQGLWPNTISTDLHTGSMNDGMKNMLNVVSNMMALGMPLQEAIKASTWNPARAIQREDLGHLSEGAEADIALFRLHEGEFGFLDSRGYVISGDEKLETELTIRAGRVVYDLNGIAAPRWGE